MKKLYNRNYWTRWIHLAEFLLNKGYEVHGIKRRTSLINTSRIDHLYQAPMKLIEILFASWRLN